MAYGAEQRQQERRLPAQSRCHRDLRGPLPLPRPGTPRWAGRPGRAGALRLPERPGQNGADLPDHRRRAGVAAGGPGPVDGRRAHHHVGATRWWSTPAARRSSWKRSRRRRAATRMSPTAARCGPALGALRPGGGGGGGRPGRDDARRVGVARFVATDIARFKAPRAVAVSTAVRRHANGKPDYTWATGAALEAQAVTGQGGR